MCAGHVSGADRDVGPLLHGFHQARQIGRIVGEIGVHLDDHIGMCRSQELVECGGVGAPQALLPGAVHHRDQLIARGDLLGQLTGSVGGRIVYDEDPVALSGDGRHEVGEILLLVVRGYDDGYPVRQHSPDRAFVACWPAG